MRVFVLAGVLFGLSAAPAGAITVTPAHPVVGDSLTVTGVVGNTGNFQPALFVDWKAGACPADRTAAKASVKDRSRGFGVASLDPAAGDPTTTFPFKDKVLIEQRKQRVCAYDRTGALAGEVLVAGMVRFPGPAA